MDGVVLLERGIVCGIVINLRAIHGAETGAFRGTVSMILTDSGIDALSDGRDSVVAWLLSVSGIQWSSPPLAYQQSASAKRTAASGSAVACSSGGQMSERSADHVPTELVPDEGSLTPREQKARVVALRGLSQAREGELDAARQTFSDAIRLDPKLDLSRLPSFWKLPRQTHDCVIEALYDADRTRDAASIIAYLRTRFRPRLLPGRPDR